MAIVARGDQIETVDATTFNVRSQSQPNLKYRVTVVRNRWSCSCAFFMESEGVPCIHLLAVKFRAGFVETAKASAPETTECVRCHSSDVVLSGRRANKSGPVRRFRCKTCGAYFSGREGFHRRRADPDMIAKALDLYFRGTSLRNVSEHFRQAYGLKISHVAVYRWITSYSKIAAEWMDAQGAKVGETWHVDERVINVDGEHRYLWNILDGETRFLLATAVSNARSLAETCLPFERAKEATEVRPTEIRSDGMNSYPWAIEREFGPGVHRPVEGIRAEVNNNRVERLHGSEKDRTKVMRAYDNDTGAAALSEGWRVHYNVVRDHMALGTTPGLKAGLPDLGEFRWKELIIRASEYAAEVERETPAAPPAPEPEVPEEPPLEPGQVELEFWIEDDDEATGRIVTGERGGYGPDE